jgi:membrane protease YdiL (CAAX protease family)
VAVTKGETKRDWMGRALILLVVFALLAFGLPMFLRLAGAHEQLEALGPDAFTWAYVATGVILVLAVTMALRRKGPGGAFRALGLAPFTAKGVALAVLSLTALAFVASRLGHPFVMPALGTALSLGLVGPFAEELLFRGFLFRQGRDWAQMPFWGAAAVSSLLYGLGHFSQGDSLSASILAVLISFATGMVFCWLTERWGGLWPAIVLHAGLDFLWLVYLLGDNAIGGEVGNAARLSALVVMVAGTLFFTRRPKA